MSPRESHACFYLEVILKHIPPILCLYPVSSCAPLELTATSDFGTLSHILLDTPGQIEIFTWSASGSIITESIASSMPTCVAYVIDTPRTVSPSTFMSNMLYACS